MRNTDEWKEESLYFCVDCLMQQNYNCDIVVMTQLNLNKLNIFKLEFHEWSKDFVNKKVFVIKLRNFRNKVYTQNQV